MEWPLMAHQTCGAPLLYSSGAPGAGAPLAWKTLMAHHAHGAPLVNFFLLIFPNILMAHHGTMRHY